MILSVDADAEPLRGKAKKMAWACRLLPCCKNLSRKLGGVTVGAKKKDVEEHRASRIGATFTRPETMEDRLEYCRRLKCKNLIEVLRDTDLNAPPCCKAEGGGQ